MKINFKILLILTLIVVTILVLFCCFNNKKEDKSWKTDNRFDLSIPTLDKDGWYLVFEDDFNGDKLNDGIVFGEKYVGNKEIWTYSPHAIRWESDNSKKPEQACYWCDEMVEIKNSNLIIHSRFETEHKCNGECPSTARFTGGIETRKIVGDNNNNKGTNDDILFSQAYGYFECKVKFPKSKGLWSAFWLQSSNMRKIGNDGKDGTEIDVFESAFINSKTPKMGHALLWDGYGSDSKCEDYVTTDVSDLYDGYHTYALKWTPEYYVFYIDGKATWATDAGGVSTVKEFLRFTVEIDAGDKYGPHGQKIGIFIHDNSENDDFMVDYIKVYQNENYEEFIKDDSEYSGTHDMKN